MRKILIPLAVFSLFSISSAAESFRLVLDNAHSEKLVNFLESEGVEIVRAAPFAEIRKSQEVVDHLGKFAEQQQRLILQARTEFWSGSKRAEPGEQRYQERYYALRDAKIRHRLALQAIASCVPELAVVESRH